MNHTHKFYGWYLVAVLWLVYFITIGFVFYGANVINTAMVRDLGMDRKTLGAGFALFHLMQSGLSAPFAAMLINRKGIRFTLALGCILAAAGSLLMATVVASSTLFLVVFGILIGLGIGLGGVLGVQTGITLWFVRKRALAMSLALITLFSILGRLIGGMLGDSIEPRHVWGASLALMCAGVLMCMSAENTLSLYLYVIFVGSGFGCAFVLMPTVIGNFFGPYAFASIVGIISPLFTLFSSASPFIAGLIHDRTGSYDTAFIGASLFCVMGMVAILAVKPTEE